MSTSLCSSPTSLSATTMQGLDSTGSRTTQQERELVRRPSSYHHRSRNSTSKKCSALCCGFNRFSVSSADSSKSSGRFDPCPSLQVQQHAIVQERLERMIKEEIRGSCMWRRTSRRADHGDSSKYVLLVAVDKKSLDPIEDFRESMWEVIVCNKMREPKELRRLLNCYISINPQEHRHAILEAFHEVCTALFTS